MTTYELGGGGGNSFSFGPQGAQPGAFVSGIVLELKEVQETNYDSKEPEFWANGDPKMQLRMTLQTELRDADNPQDDGLRNVFLSGYKKPHPKTGTSGTLYAVMLAVQAVTGGTAIASGGKVTLQWVSGMGFTGDPRHYVAWYEAPAMDLAGPPQQAAPPPGVAPAAPPVQQYTAPPVQPMQQQLQQAAPPVAPPEWAVPTTPPGIPAALQGIVQGQPVTLPPVQQAAPPAAAAPAPAPADGPNAAQIAAVRAAGLDPATVFPGWQG